MSFVELSSVIGQNRVLDVAVNPDRVFWCEFHSKETTELFFATDRKNSLVVVGKLQNVVEKLGKR